MYQKEILLTVAPGKTVSFFFNIINRGGEYVIYPINYPGKHIYNGVSHEAHLLTDYNGRPIVCWDKPILNFSDANAIMYVWAKQYTQMYFSNLRSNKKPILPRGTFRKGEINYV